jgi:hypothetical protein
LTILDKIKTFFRRYYAIYTGKALQVNVIAMPMRGLAHEFIYQINGGPWASHKITVAAIFVSDLSPLEYFEKNCLPYHVDRTVAPPARLKYEFVNVNLITNQKEIKRIVKSLLDKGVQNG